MVMAKSFASEPHKDITGVSQYYSRVPSKPGPGRACLLDVEIPNVMSQGDLVVPAPFAHPLTRMPEVEEVLARHSRCVERVAAAVGIKVNLANQHVPRVFFPEDHVIWPGEKKVKGGKVRCLVLGEQDARVVRLRREVEGETKEERVRWSDNVRVGRLDADRAVVDWKLCCDDSMEAEARASALEGAISSVKFMRHDAVTDALVETPLNNKLAHTWKAFWAGVMTKVFKYGRYTQMFKNETEDARSAWRALCAKHQHHR